ncbi:MAG: dTDP-4-dehydrorhamnose 3,5-epimerase family protein [Fidelibacterota bacterium]
MSGIDGVVIKKLTLHSDLPDLEDSPARPGFLMEVVREDDGLMSHFGQSTFTVAYEGTIKAFHWHRKQDDLWFVATGKAVVVLHDLRKGSPTFGLTQAITAGKDDYKVILIPSGVAHGYKVVSEEPVLLFYHSTRSYDRDNPDEERIPWNDSTIGFDWAGVE